MLRSSQGTYRPQRRVSLIFKRKTNNRRVIKNKPLLAMAIIRTTGCHHEASTANGSQGFSPLLTRPCFSLKTLSCLLQAQSGVATIGIVNLMCFQSRTLKPGCSCGPVTQTICATPSKKFLGGPLDPLIVSKLQTSVPALECTQREAM